MASTDRSLFSDALQEKMDAVIDAVNALRDGLGSAAHPQEFGMDGCPACKVNDLVSDASLALQEAEARMRAWQAEARSE